MAIRRRDPHVWGEVVIGPGDEVDVEVPVSESYSGRSVNFPVHIKRGELDGPVVFVTAAVHGDELNGTAAIRSLIVDPEVKLERGTLILVPVVNVLGFETHSRYLPDRRDLNRCFPGSASGSQASRLARVVFEEIVGRCDYGIDLHTASIRRTNYPNVRGDMRLPEIQALAEAFGCEVIVNEPGPEGGFRRSATDAGCPTIILEAGEIWKMEPAVVECARAGIKNVLRHHQMLAGERLSPPIQHVVQRTQWVRANHAGFLEFHVVPGSVVRGGQPLVTTTTLLGRNPQTVVSPADGIVMGLTTLPVTAPGEPICHLGYLPAESIALDSAVVRLTDVA